MATKKGTMKVFFLFSVAFEVASLSFHMAKMCLSFFFFFFFPPSVFEGSCRHGRRKNGRVLDYYPNSTGDPSTLRLCPLPRASSWSLGQTPAWSLASYSSLLLFFCPLLKMRWGGAEPHWSSWFPTLRNGQSAVGLASLLTRLYFISFFIWLGHCTLINSLHSFMPCP